MFAIMGVMVGFYIITKMADLLSARFHQPKLGAAGFLAIITILFTLFAMAHFVLGPDLIKAGVGLK